MSYYPPLRLIHTEYTVTDKDLLNAIVDGPVTGGIYHVQAISDTAFDGVLNEELLLNNGTWSNVGNVHLTGGPPNPKVSADTDAAWGATIDAAVATFPAYPFQVRWRVATKATAGKCLVVIDYLPG